ncbi:MAG: hypothetical protein LBH69_02990 [Methanomassiliicoccaceae archaeon]|jgi:hypothetical protein|nr:hypothetical protein [Methanomassiliicoccaceae archaeon]
MGRKIHPIEREVDAIRLRMYEETKDMTSAEISEYIREKTDATIKEYGIRVVSDVNGSL